MVRRIHLRAFSLSRVTRLRHRLTVARRRHIQIEPRHAPGGHLRRRALAGVPRVGRSGDTRARVKRRASLERRTGTLRDRSALSLERAGSEQRTLLLELARRRRRPELEVVLRERAFFLLLERA